MSNNEAFEQLRGLLGDWVSSDENLFVRQSEALKKGINFKFHRKFENATCKEILNQLKIGTEDFPYMFDEISGSTTKFNMLINQQEYPLNYIRTDKILLLPRDKEPLRLDLYNGKVLIETIYLNYSGYRAGNGHWELKFSTIGLDDLVIKECDNVVFKVESELRDSIVSYFKTKTVQSKKIDAFYTISHIAGDFLSWPRSHENIKEKRYKLEGVLKERFRLFQMDVTILDEILKVLDLSGLKTAVIKSISEKVKTYNHVDIKYKDTRYFYYLNNELSETKGNVEAFEVAEKYYLRYLENASRLTVTLEAMQYE